MNIKTSLIQVLRQTYNNLLPPLLKATGTGTIDGTQFMKNVLDTCRNWLILGKNFNTNNHIAFEGPNQPIGSSVKATDLRAGAAMVMLV